MKYLKFWLGLLFLSFGILAFAPQPSQAPLLIADSWEFPISNDGYVYGARQNAQYGTATENTNYAVRNLDLVMGTNGITCFGVAAHRLLNGGVDLYRMGASTIGAQVKAVANGVVSYVGSNYPGDVVVLSHTLPNSTTVSSLYGHLTLTTPLTVGTILSKGAVLGTVIPLTYTGNFTALHPTGDHAHLHFEMRNFADATTQGLPAACNAQYGPAGMGYVYSRTVSAYGYLNPLAFLRQQGAASTAAHQVYLPITGNTAAPTCQEGQDLLQNGNFEAGTLSDPLPWLEASTLGAWNAPLVGTTVVREGLRSAKLGGWDNGQRVDEELRQSFILPANTFSVTWVMRMRLVPDDLVNPDLDDYFILNLDYADTGRGILLDEKYNAATIPFTNTWFIAEFYVYGLTRSVPQSIGLRYSGWNDETRATLFAIDTVSFRTHCISTNGPRVANEEEGLRWEVQYKPLLETPMVTQDQQR